MSTETDARYAQAKAAFESDGWMVIPVPSPQGPLPYVEKDGWVGVMAELPGGRWDGTRDNQKAYYVEGPAKAAGWLLGFMAEAAVWRMAIDYSDNVIWDFVHMEGVEHSKSPFVKRLKSLLIKIIYELSKPMAADIPQEYQEELAGMEEGCYAANPARYGDEATKRNFTEHLWGLNYGIDCLLAHLYTGTLFKKKGFRPRHFKIPFMCNAFSLRGQAAGGKHFFGRDFMFPTAGVLQDVACFVVYGAKGAGEGALLHVSHTAPGIVGSITGVNERGVAIGIDMVPTMLSDPSRPGFNSLGLNRDVLKRATGLDSAKRRVIDAQRGVSWLYPMASANEGASILEAGRRVEEDETFPNLDPVSKYYRKRLPSLETLEALRQKYGNPKAERGVMDRSETYAAANELLDYNKGLWKAFNHNCGERVQEWFGDFVAAWSGLFKGSIDCRQFRRDLVDSFFPYAKYNPSGFAQRGFLQGDRTEKNLPGGYYFPPQRERRDDFVMVTNYVLTPEMRLQAMNPWIDLLGGGWQADFQWRYDTLNDLIVSKLDGRSSPLEESEAWRLINYLSPDPTGPCSDYYNPGYAATDWRALEVIGTVSLVELTERRITSLSGQYGDAPATLNLMAFSFAKA
jgi:hypothetical protein